MKISYYAASYGPRYGDPVGTLVAMDRGQTAGIEVCDKVMEAAVKAAREEEETLKEYCDDEECEGCTLCDPDVVIYGSGCLGKAKGLFTAEELKEHRAALRRGEVIWLGR